jgi:hypothetical protein
LIGRLWVILVGDELRRALTLAGDQEGPGRKVTGV